MPVTDEKRTSPSVALDTLAQSALTIAKKARQHGKSLGGDNFYGNKLAQLRVDATNAFTNLKNHSMDDTTALAVLIDLSFSAKTKQNDRLNAVRDLSHELKTSWREKKGGSKAPGNELFPLALITKANRGYLTTIAKQMNGTRREGWYDACAVMMRRLVEIVIIEAFEKAKISQKIKDPKGDYVQLTALVEFALAETTFNLSRNTKKALPQLKNIGHQSAHGRYFTAQSPDIDKAESGLRVVIEEFLHLAALL